MSYYNLNWYRYAFTKMSSPPYVGEVREVIYDIGKSVKEMGQGHVKEVYVFGSFVNSYATRNIKDLDIVAVVDFTSDELISCLGDFFDYNNYDCEAVREFTDRFVGSFANYNLDPWVITEDGKVLHWGPLVDTSDMMNEIEDAAWEYAMRLSDFDITDYGFSDPEDIEEHSIMELNIDDDIKDKLLEFKELYDKYVSDAVDYAITDGERGWYEFEDLDAQYIMTHGYKIA